MEVSGQLHAPATLPPGKSPRYPFYRRFGGPQSRSGRYGEVKIFILRRVICLPSPGLFLAVIFDPEDAAVMFLRNIRDFHTSTLHYIAEHRTPHSYRCENLKLSKSEKHSVAYLAETLCYKPEDSGFESR
jgi:hypothetical protein